MERIFYTLKAGSIKNLRIEKGHLDEPAPDEIQVEVKAIGLNFADIFAIWGLYSATPTGQFTPGLEYSGLVLKTGSSVTNFKAGDRIMGVTRFGAYCSHLNVDHRYMIPLPDDWSFDQGAGYLVQVLTAYYALVYLGNLEKDMVVLIHSAAGGVGIWANRIAKLKGAHTIGTVGSESKFQLLQQEGYDQYLVRSKSFGTDLDRCLGDRELNLIMECIGGKILVEGYERLAPQGRMIAYGSARYAHAGARPNYLKLALTYFSRPKIDPQKMIEQNKAVMGFNLIWLYSKVELMHRVLREIRALELGQPLVGHRYPFDELPDALTFFKTGKSTGKIVVEP